MNSSLLSITQLLWAFSSCTAQNDRAVHESDNLRIENVTPHTFRHISFLKTENSGTVACNGMVVIDNNEALVFDTPVNDLASRELIDWVNGTLKCSVVGIVVTHFHNDCLGGSKEFHERKIPSYASFQTIDLAKLDSVTIPQHGFETYLELMVGNTKVINEYFGEGHTRDNIVSYFEKEQVLFGGCLIKTLGADKGYLGDANTNEWSTTVEAVRSKYQDAKIVIPGHGEPGDTELLDYTIELFKNE